MIIQRFLFGILRGGILLGLLSLCLHGSAQASAQRILVLGDSISAAYGMSLEQGWVAMLAERLSDAEPGYEVVNASISGETTAGGLRRLPELLARHQPGLVIIELGANDGMRGYPLKSLRGNLSTMTQLAQEAGAKVILLAMEIPPNYGARYTAGFRDSFAEVAANTGAVLGPFVLDGVATDPALMQEDGIHPRAEAQPMLLDNVLPTIMTALAEP